METWVQHDAKMECHLIRKAAENIFRGHWRAAWLLDIGRDWDEREHST